MLSTTELLIPYLDAQDDIAYGAPMAAATRLEVAKQSLFLCGVSRSDLEELAGAAQTEALLLEAELEIL